MAPRPPAPSPSRRPASPARPPARPHVRGRALVCYGDTLANVDLAALARQHEDGDALLTLAVYPLHSPYGIVTFDAGRRVTGFREKPRLPHWINIGFMLCEPAAL